MSGLADGDAVWFSETGTGTPVWISRDQGPSVTVTRTHGTAVWHGPKVGEPISVRNPDDLPEFVKRELDWDGTSNFL